MSSPRRRQKRQYRGPARSCEHCYGWGILRQRLCRGCEGFAAKYEEGTCQTCRRDRIPVDTGVCRLCRKQATQIAGPGNKTATDLTVAATTGHQLFLTDFTRSARRRSARDTQNPEQVVAAAGPNPLAQPVLFAMPRDCRRASSRDGPRDRHFLDLVARKAAAIAELNGWPPRTLQQVRRGLGMLASSYDPGEPIHASTVTAMSPHGVPGLRVLEVLAEAVPELLIDDRPDSLTVWIDDAFGGIPANMRNEVDVWVGALRRGTPRRAARPRATVVTRLAAATPFIRACADQYETLRQVTKDDVLSWLETSPRPAHDASALRDLFRVLKARRLVFANPMRGIRASRPEQRIPAPIATESLGIIGAAAAQDPALKAVLALIGVQALHSAQTRTLTLDDLDLQNHRLAVQGVSTAT